MSGWIKIHRDILYHEIWSDKPFSKGQAWIDLILLANHSDNKCMVGNKVEEVKRGSFITSELKLMDRWGWGRKKVQLFLKFLESESMIVRSANNKRTATMIDVIIQWLPIMPELQSKHWKSSCRRSRLNMRINITLVQFVEMYLCINMKNTQRFLQIGRTDCHVVCLVCR